MPRRCKVCGKSDCFEQAMDANGVIPLDTPRRQDMENTIPAPERVIDTAANGNRVVLYEAGDPMPLEEATARGYVGRGRPAAGKAVDESENKAVTAPATKSRPVAKPTKKRKG